MSTNETSGNPLEMIKNLQQRYGSNDKNVSEAERTASIIGGGLLTLYGLTRLSVPGILLAGVGADVLYRGITGHCWTYQALGINTAEVNQNPEAPVQAKRSIKVKKSITINKPREELYSFWRDFENLPRIMQHLESVKTEGATRSHWTAKAPAGQKVEWDAEIINEKENELIAWKSLEGAQVPNAGSVQFSELGDGRGTEVKVELDYEPPAGALGALIAKLLGEEPEQQVQEDLRNFKQIMEAGEIPTTDGQPSL